MDLFSTANDPSINILPFDGTVNYYGTIFTADEADKFAQNLFTDIDWRNDKSFIYGKLITTKRKVGWYGDEAFDYTYSKTTKKALPWTDELQEIKYFTEEKTGEQ